MVQRQRAQAEAAIEARREEAAAAQHRAEVAAAEVRGMEAVLALTDLPPPSAGEGASQGGAESVINMPISEQDQAVEVVSEARADLSEPAKNIPISIPSPAPGTYRIADLRHSQCRFACTPDSARPDEHRFCGAPTRVGRGNLHGSWCDAHLPRVWSAGRTPGGASVADSGGREPERARPPAGQRGWGFGG